MGLVEIRFSSQLKAEYSLTFLSCMQVKLLGNVGNAVGHCIIAAVEVKLSVFNSLDCTFSSVLWALPITPLYNIHLVASLPHATLSLLSSKVD